MSIALAFALLALGFVLIVSLTLQHARGLGFALAAGGLAIAGTFALYAVIATLITVGMD